MVWTEWKWAFSDFLFLFPASIIGWFVTSFILSKFLPKGKPEFNIQTEEEPELKDWAKVIIGLWVFTIASAVMSHQLFDFPAMWGMMFWLSLLKLYAYFLKRRAHRTTFDIYASMRLIENDTLLFFFGILAAVWALHFIGFLHYIVNLYGVIGSTSWNIAVWFVSAIVDNVPVMSAILKADPSMPLSQWMLVTLTAWIGWSLISFGSAAGVGVMGRMKGIYTFNSHMKLAWTILVGYAVSIAIWYVQFEILKIY
jgi:Na+/H+ antiporter NhaD/arsenite permease-like protein